MVYGFTQSAFTNPHVGNGDSGGDQGNYYLGATLNSPWKDVTFGAAFDYVQNLGGVPISGTTHADVYVFGLYNTIKATDKLSFNSRGEYWEIDGFSGSHYQGGDGGISLTEDVEYDLWANVTSRLELRYDKATSGTAPGTYVLPTGVTMSKSESVGLYANVVYKF
jgi:hypothetical protein